MANKQRNLGFWSSFRIWIHQNQKIIWVGLLVLGSFSFGFVGPVQDFFTRSAQQRMYAEVYGAPVTEIELQRLLGRLGVVQGMLEATVQAGFMAQYQSPTPPLPTPPALMDAYLAMVRSYQGAPLDFLAFRKKAGDDGLRVSDGELADYVRFLWQRHEALRMAAADISKTDASKVRSPEYEIYRKFPEKELELSARPFDVRSWQETIDRYSRQGRAHVLPVVVEDTLRDVVLVGKLTRQVRNSVKVTPQEVFERFNKEEQKRDLSWIEYPITDALREKVSKTVTAQDLSLHYDANQQKYRAGDSVKGSWLLLPRKHFETEAASKIADADLQSYYEEYRNDYRKPEVLAAEAQFYPLSAAEREKLDQRLFRSLDEVKDAVREKVIQKRAASDMSDLAEKLRRRIFPTKEANEPAPPKPASFAELVTEYPFLETGTADYATKEDAKAAFGRGHGTQVERWFEAIDDATRGSPSRSQKPKVEAPLRPMPGDEGMVFYADVAHRAPMLRRLKDVEEKVRDEVVLDKSLELVKKALEPIEAKVDKGELSFEDAAKQPLDVEVGSEKVTLQPRAIQKSAEPVEKDGSVMVASASTPETTPPPDAKPEAGKEPATPSTTRVEASVGIRTAGFAAEDKGKVRAGTSVETKAAYLVRVDGITLPDPKDFADSKQRIEAGLLSERQNDAFATWRTTVRDEAGLSRSDAAPEGEAQGPAGA